jgi:23S rRNA pseudouridine2605 synthase
MLNKPVGYVTTMSDEKGRKTVADLVADVGERVYPVGRLDINSDGLLLMTNDGELANHIMHPSFEKKKVYRVYVTGDIQNGIETLKKPMELDGVMLRKPDLRLIKNEGNSAIIDIAIHEGKNRQIRRMCDTAGLYVNRLTRISVGSVRLGDLKKGSWRHLTPDEVTQLRKY